MTSEQRALIQQSANCFEIADMYGLKVVNARTNCPWHDDANPSMRIFKDHVHCYACGAHKDVIDFTEALGNMTFSEAISFLSKVYGIKIDDIRNDTRKYVSLDGLDAFGINKSVFISAFEAGSKDLFETAIKLIADSISASEKIEQSKIAQNEGMKTVLKEKISKGKLLLNKINYISKADPLMIKLI